MAALDAVLEVLKSCTVEYPDGEVEDFSQVQIDAGFVTEAARFPYVSVHTSDARMKTIHLGRGESMASKQIEVDVLVAIEYEDADQERGFRRMTQLRWDVIAHLMKNSGQIPGATFTTFEESVLNSIAGEDGGFNSWGYIGVVMIPFTVTFRGI